MALGLFKEDESSNQQTFFRNKDCPSGWYGSLEANRKTKCYKAFKEEYSWGEQGCPAGSRIAIVDTPERNRAVASALCAADLNNCWVGAKQWPPQVSTSTDFFWFSIPFNDVQPFRVEHRFIDDKCFTSTNLGRCLTANHNGKGFCNDDCATRKCFVCELHQKYDN